MSKPKTPAEELPEGQASARWLAILTQPASAAGVIPDGHKGFYQPSAEELRKGFRAMLKLNTKMAEEQTKLAEAVTRNLFGSKDGEQ